MAPNHPSDDQSAAAAELRRLLDAQALNLKLQQDIMAHRRRTRMQVALACLLALVFAWLGWHPLADEHADSGGAGTVSTLRLIVQFAGLGMLGALVWQIHQGIRQLRRRSEALHRPAP